MGLSLQRTEVFQVPFIVRLPDPADVPLAVSPREGLGDSSDRIMATDSSSVGSHSGMESDVVSILGIHIQ